MPAVAPIDRLSDDLLYEVFVLYVKSWHYTTSLGPTRFFSFRNRWVRGITHVCRRWRTIAIQSPVLWTEFVLSDPASTAVFLERTRETPFSVSGDFGNKEDVELIRGTLGAVLQHSDRIADLKILWPVYPPDILQTFSPSSFLRLTTLSLGSLAAGNPDITVPQFLDTRDLPALEELRTELYPMSVIAQSGLPLHRIKIFSFSNYRMDPVPMHEVLEILAGMPMLEELSISASFSEFDSPPSIQTHQASLVRLKRFSISSPAIGAVALLQRLTLPSDVVVNANLQNIRLGQAAPNLPTLPLIAALFIDKTLKRGRRDVPSISTLSVHISDWNSNKIHIRAWTCPPSPGDLAAHSDALLRDCDVPDREPMLDIRLSHFSYAKIFQQFCTALPLSRTPLLFISCNSEADETRSISKLPELSDWMALFEQMPGVHMFWATTGAIRCLPEILVSKKNVAHDTREANPFRALPHLRRLCFQADRTMNPSFAGLGGWLKKVEDALRVRTRAKFMLGYLGLPVAYEAAVKEARLLEGTADVALQVALCRP